MNDPFKITPGWAVCLFLTLGIGGSELASADDIICCGGEEVFVIDPSNPSAKKWTWQADDAPSIPASFRAKFRSTDDCKPYRDDKLLITSSSGGVALIQRSTKKCLFLAESRNAHSAALLPNDGVAVAASYGGDEMQFYDLADRRKPAVPVQTIPLIGAHGAVWDKKRQCLWALGGDELLRLVANDQASAGKRWSIKSQHPLPSPGGHDLSPLHDGVHLFVTSNTQVLLFDCDKMKFKRHPDFGDQLKIKSVDLHPVTKTIVFHKASKTRHIGPATSCVSSGRTRCNSKANGFTRFAGTYPQFLDPDTSCSLR
jgi:hypothetical protein